MADHSTEAEVDVALFPLLSTEDLPEPVGAGA